MITIGKDKLVTMNIQYKYWPLKKFLDDTVDCGVQNIELWGAAPHFHPCLLYTSPLRTVL